MNDLQIKYLCGLEYNVAMFITNQMTADPGGKLADAQC